jgi:NADPH:quinone reductase-like Zn-dependent oxidoreductase
MRTMKAVQIERFGGPEVLRLRDVAVPEPRSGEILLKNHATSVNPVDYKIRLGEYPVVKDDKLPYVPGRDAAGVVEAVGPGVEAFAAGEALFAMPGIDRGGYAEYVVVKESEAAHAPATLDPINAAAVPLAALTA